MLLSARQEHGSAGRKNQKPLEEGVQPRRVEKRRQKLLNRTENPKNWENQIVELKEIQNHEGAVQWRKQKSENTREAARTTHENQKMRPHRAVERRKT